MGQLIAMPNKPQKTAETDLFSEEFAVRATELRKQEQHQRLVQRAKEVAEMLDQLDGLLSVDRERAVSMLAEQTGLLELVVEDIRCIRDMDESFGSRSRRQPRIAHQALKLERGIAYLLGIFSVVSSGEVLPVYNWKLVQRDVQEVLGVAHDIAAFEQPPELRKAA